MQEPALLSDFSWWKYGCWGKKSCKTANKFSQQDPGPTSVVWNSDEPGRRRGNNQTNHDLTNGLNLVVVPALSSPLTWRDWEIIVIGPNCRKAIIWHIGCYGSDWLFSRCSWEDATGSFCRIKRWKQFQNKLLCYKTSLSLVWNSGLKGRILKALLEFQVWICLGLATDHLPLGVVEFVWTESCSLENSGWVQSLGFIKSSYQSRVVQDKKWK